MGNDITEEKPNLNVEYEITVKNSNTRKVIEHYKKHSESLVKNFLMLLNAGFKVSTASLIDTGGVARAGSAKYCVSYSVSCMNQGSGASCGGGGWAIIADAADDTYGIIIGAGTTPVAVSDYNLVSKIVHGNNLGQMWYYATTLPNPTVDGNIVRQRFERTFINNSGAGITVKEIGMVLKTGGDNYMIMIVRDVLETPATVPNGYELRVRYYIITGS